MKHFVGGFSVGMIFAVIGISTTKKPTKMSDSEFSYYVAAHFLLALPFGLAAWGLM